MEILYLLIPLSVVLVFFIAIIFWMSVRGGQFEDLEGPGYRMLMDDDSPVEQDRANRNKVDAGQKLSRLNPPE